MIGVGIEVNDELRAEAEAAVLEGRIVQVVERGMVRLRAQAQRNLKENQSIATGQLRRSLSMTGADTDGHSVEGWLGVEQYGLYVEFGTRPHWPPLLTPEGGGILRWVVAKGLVRFSDKWKDKAPTGRLRSALGISLTQAQEILAHGSAKAAAMKAAKARVALSEGGGKWSAMEQEELQVARVVQVSIARHGTKEHPFLRPAIEDTFDAFLRDLVRTLEGGRP